MAATIVDFETLSLKINYFFSASAFEFGCHGKLEQDNSTTQLPMLLAGRDSLLPWTEQNLILRNLPVLLFAFLKTVWGYL